MGQYGRGLSKIIDIDARRPRLIRKGGRRLRQLMDAWMPFAENNKLCVVCMYRSIYGWVGAHVTNANQLSKHARKHHTWIYKQLFERWHEKNKMAETTESRTVCWPTENRESGGWAEWRK
jgi:hypothetical protein